MERGTMVQRILVSLGGNALGTHERSLREMADAVAAPIATLVQEGYELIFCHGNGPQVGALQNAFGTKKHINRFEAIYLADSVAMTQGYMGYQLQNAIETELRKRGNPTQVATLVTRTLVDKNDPMFQNPTKPVGPFYTAEEAKELEELGKVMREDAGRGYREVVPSPIPVQIIESDAIRALLEHKILVIAGGGGGIPVLDDDGRLASVDAVIDKDYVSAEIAIETDCDLLVILTGVESVYTGFNTEHQQKLTDVTPEDVRKYADCGEFAPGSMLPKISAAAQFVESKPRRRALITSLETLVEGLEGKTGTWITQQSGSESKGL